MCSNLPFTGTRERNNVSTSIANETAPDYPLLLTALYTPALCDIYCTGLHSVLPVDNIQNNRQASLMTGRDSFRTGMQYRELDNPMPWGVPLDEVTLAERFKARGYATHMVRAAQIQKAHHPNF